ncbi:unnamed protein product [Schistosoma curassoni]|uniref:Reverse transcriptase domain-containing protein n=1 Tax=Schistosoma curassoni TaxID=6186 RepID=A0A183K3S7_9TREM|nr:unnamed protein product [Schistosoma curassoni]
MDLCRNPGQDPKRKNKKAVINNNLKQLYDTMKKLVRKYSKPERLIKDKKLKPITEIQEQKKRWVKHFVELWNSPAPLDSHDIEVAHTDIHMDVTPPTVEEIRMAIISKEEQEPLTDWKEGHLIKTPKNGDLSKCKNHKGITLLSVPGKVLSKILLNSMKDAVDTQLRNQQAGFRKDRSCADQITTLRIIVQQSIEWNSSLYINFCDYGKPFDSVARRLMEPSSTL